MNRRELGESKGIISQALGRLVALELVREELADNSRRVSVHDARVGFYLRT